MKKSQSKRRQSARSLARRLRGDRRGSTAVEFAIIAPVFLTMMFSNFEVGWFYFANSVVDSSVGDASRMIRTGQVQQLPLDDDEKKQFLFDKICSIVDTFGDCDQRLTVEVQTYGSFAALAAASSDPAVCADAPPADLDNLPFDMGGELAIVRVRVCFIYKTMNPAIGINLAEDASGNRRLVSTMIFRSEPYERNTSQAGA